jgi:hypothetical protein
MDDRWEHKIIHVSADQRTTTGLPSDLNEHFDQFGADGWELVATEAIVRPGFLSAANTVAILGFFKRRLRG